MPLKFFILFLRFSPAASSSFASRSTEAHDKTSPRDALTFLSRRHDSRNVCTSVALLAFLPTVRTRYIARMFCLLLSFQSEKFTSASHSGNGNVNIGVSFRNQVFVYTVNEGPFVISHRRNIWNGAFCVWKRHFCRWRFTEARLVFPEEQMHSVYATQLLVALAIGPTLHSFDWLREARLQCGRTSAEGPDWRRFVWNRTFVLYCQWQS